MTCPYPKASKRTKGRGADQGNGLAAPGGQRGEEGTGCAQPAVWTGRWGHHCSYRRLVIPGEGCGQRHCSLPLMSSWEPSRCRQSNVLSVNWNRHRKAQRSVKSSLRSQERRCATHARTPHRQVLSAGVCSSGDPLLTRPRFPPWLRSFLPCCRRPSQPPGLYAHSSQISGVIFFNCTHRSLILDAQEVLSREKHASNRAHKEHLLI